jgi:hypothetical protein
MSNEDVSTAKPGAVDLQQVIAIINRARAAYGASPIEHLPSGLIRNPSHCPLARAFRIGVSDRLFFAVGSEQLRIEAVDRDAAKVADAMRTAWYGSRRFVEGDPVTSIVRMLPELCAFVKHFDSGTLPAYVGTPDENESASVALVARRIADAKAANSDRRAISPAKFAIARDWRRQSR